MLAGQLFYDLSHSSSHFLHIGIFEIGCGKLFAQMALNLDPP
jgi:hypothetical protein